MVQFYDSVLADIANIETSTLIGLTGGTVGDLLDGIGDEFLFSTGSDIVRSGSGDDSFISTVARTLSAAPLIVDGNGGTNTIRLMSSGNSVQPYYFGNSLLSDIHRIEFVYDPTPHDPRVLSIFLNSSQFVAGQLQSVIFDTNDYPGDTDQIYITVDTPVADLSSVQFSQWESDNRVAIDGTTYDHGNLVITGTSQNDTVYGDDGDDAISGGFGGDDRISDWTATTGFTVTSATISSVVVWVTTRCSAAPGSTISTATAAPIPCPMKATPIPTPPPSISKSS